MQFDSDHEVIVPAEGSDTSTPTTAILTPDSSTSDGFAPPVFQANQVNLPHSRFEGYSRFPPLEMFPPGIFPEIPVLSSMPQRAGPRDSKRNFMPFHLYNPRFRYPGQASESYRPGGLEARRPTSMTDHPPSDVAVRNAENNAIWSRMMRECKGRLADSQRQTNELSRRWDKLQLERDNLAAEKAALQGERVEPSELTDALIVEREKTAKVLAQCAVLKAEQMGCTKEIENVVEKMRGNRDHWLDNVELIDEKIVAAPKIEAGPELEKVAWHQKAKTTSEVFPRNGKTSTGGASFPATKPSPVSQPCWSSRAPTSTW